MKQPCAVFAHRSVLLRSTVKRPESQGRTPPAKGSGTGKEYRIPRFPWFVLPMRSSNGLRFAGATSQNSGKPRGAAGALLVAVANATERWILSTVCAGINLKKPQVFLWGSLYARHRARIWGSPEGRRAPFWLPSSTRQEGLYFLECLQG